MRILISVTLFILIQSSASAQIEKNDHFLGLAFDYNRLEMAEDVPFANKREYSMVYMAYYKYAITNHWMITAGAGLRPFTRPIVQGEYYRISGKTSLPLSLGIGWNKNFNSYFTGYMGIETVFENSTMHSQYFDSETVRLDITTKFRSNSQQLIAGFMVAVAKRMFVTCMLPVVTYNRVYQHESAIVLMGEYEGNKPRTEDGFSFFTKIPSLGVSFKLNK